MYMNKTLLISIGVMIFAGLIVLAYWLTNPKSQAPATNSQNGQNTLPVANSVGNTTAVDTSTNLTSGTILSLPAVDGGTIQVNNFINDPTTAKDPINQGYYYLGYHVNEGISDPTATDNPPYIIEYISTTQYFNIALLQEPIGQVREEMQQYLMAHLGISQDQMCRLNYMVSVPERINSQFAGKNLGFSFCPGATVLPQ